MLFSLQLKSNRNRNTTYHMLHFTPLSFILIIHSQHTSFPPALCSAGFPHREK